MPHAFDAAAMTLMPLFCHDFSPMIFDYCFAAATPPLMSFRRYAAISFDITRPIPLLPFRSMLMPPFRCRR